MIAVPRQLRQRPRDKKTGFPIPYVVVVVDGAADFRVPDPDRWLTCVRDARCALCGQPLTAAWFVGGPSCEASRGFTDPAMCRDCATYALRVCPFLAMPTGHYSNVERRPPPPGYGVSAIVAPKRPERFMLGRTRGWRVIKVQGQPVIRAEPWIEVQWWRHGEPEGRKSTDPG